MAITVGEEIAAYLVSAGKLAELEAGTMSVKRRRALMGTMTIVGDLDQTLRDLSQGHEQSFERLVRQLEGSGE